MPATFSANDHRHMARALRLAERGLYSTQPNPRVGCVIVHGDAVVGEGWHQRAGEPHAEVFGLRAAGAGARGATAYVTLEPCAHFGRTPPCADALVAAGVARVVVAAEDPNPRVNGQGNERLRMAGISVDIGLMRAAARDLNRGFFARIERGMPWVRVKLAMSLDGRTALANGASKWITGAAARHDVQRWRARSSAILVGSGTLLADDPRLTVRREDAAPAGDAADAPAAPPAPLRVVLDRTLRAPAGAHVLDGAAPTLVLHAPGARPPDARYANVELQPVAEGDGGLDLRATLTLLAARGVNELQVEAGPTLCGALVAQGLADELLIYAAPVLLGGHAQALLTLPSIDDVAAGRRLRIVDQRTVGADWRIVCRLQDQ
jgi:diaminohydroxyphosphoribosylaminopyrimidine deaminase/5-amino-6-(5-phosphoribosylamino)uracil reductase